MIDWTEELIEQLCDGISGGEGISELAGKNGLPHEATIYRKMAKDAEFARRIARAREAQQDREVEKCVEMADAATPENWQVVKLRIWARQWRAAKLAPKRYGDSIGIGQAPGLAPINTGAEDAARIIAERLDRIAAAQNSAKK